MVKSNVKKAKLHLAKLRRLVSKKKTPLSNMSEEEVIKTMRKPYSLHTYFKADC